MMSRMLAFLSMLIAMSQVLRTPHKALLVHPSQNLPFA